MLGLFSKPKCIVDEEQKDWLNEQYTWLIENIGFPNEPVPLIMPTSDFFTPPPKEGHDRALHIFNEVKELMGLKDWPCQLEEQEEEINPKVDELLMVENIEPTPMGTFNVKPETLAPIIITYNSKQLNNHISLIATFAHELSHYVLLSCTKERLGTSDDEEFLTDLMAIMSGFGLFIANSRFNFTQFTDTFSQGWRSSSVGYLTENEIIFALSLFMKRYGYNSSQLENYLKNNLQKLLLKSEKYLANQN